MGVMNAGVMNGAGAFNDVGLVTQNAAMQSGSASPAAPQPATFLNLIHFLLQPDSFVQVSDPPPEVQPEPDAMGAPPGRAQLGCEMTASPAQIADALVRAMLGAGSTSDTKAPGISADPRTGVSKKNTESVLLKRSSSNAGGRSTAMMVLPPLNAAAAVPSTTEGAANAANHGSASPGTTPDASSLGAAMGGASSAADPFSVGRSSGHPGPSAETAFEARLTPKTDDPDPSSAPAAAISPMAGAPSNSSAKRDLDQDADSPSAGAGSSPGTPANSDSDGSFMSHAIGTIQSVGASGGAITPTPAPADPHHLSPTALPEPVAAQPGASSVREMTMRIATPDTPAVDVLVNQRQGEVYVAVRTADPVLQASLRQDLPQLVNSPDRAGFRTETFLPPPSTDTAVSAAAEASLSGSIRDSSADSHREARQDASGQPSNQQQQQPRQWEQMHARWLDQMED
jgi:hypothetical protein